MVSPVFGKYITYGEFKSTCANDSSNPTIIYAKLDDCIPTSCAPIRYASDTDYKRLQEKVREYLRHKEISKIRVGWNNPKEMAPILDVRPKQPIFKNHAINSKRGN